jgi:hypothetical protein
MAREPQFPKDAAVGDTTEASGAPQTGASVPAAGARDESVEAKTGDGKRTKQIVAGAAIGIGSAAIVAALLYANRRGKADRS